ncbi:Uncharacterised protein [Mycobacteroides abscessus subsp. abscessus]|nr:Uncharacterised protein [Mycobacteroides abscessus subsp. abscessus]
MPAREHDTVAVAFRNTDTARMRAQFGAQHHAMHDFQIDHGSMRAIDLKANSIQRRPQLHTPTQFSRNHAGVRGLDLMACSTGPHMHKVIRENLESFTTFIGVDEFGRIKAAQQRISQVAEGITDPIVQKISSLRDIGPFLSDPEDDDTQAAEEPALAAG